MKNVEVEIQVIVKNPEKAEARLNEVGKFVKSRKQVDTYFVPPYRDFFAKDMPDEYLRVRHEVRIDKLKILRYYDLAVKARRSKIRRC